MEDKFFEQLINPASQQYLDPVIKFTKRTRLTLAQSLSLNRSLPSPKEIKNIINAPILLHDVKFHAGINEPVKHDHIFPGLKPVLVAPNTLRKC